MWKKKISTHSFVSYTAWVLLYSYEGQRHINSFWPSSDTIATYLSQVKQAIDLWSTQVASHLEICEGLSQQNIRLLFLLIMPSLLSSTMHYFSERYSSAFKIVPSESEWVTMQCSDFHHWMPVLKIVKKTMMPLHFPIPFSFPFITSSFQFLFGHFILLGFLTWILTECLTRRWWEGLVQ